MSFQKINTSADYLSGVSNTTRIAIQVRNNEIIKLRKELKWMTAENIRLKDEINIMRRTNES